MSLRRVRVRVQFSLHIAREIILWKLHNDNRKRTKYRLRD